MNNETKVALKKAFKIAKIIFGLGDKQYSKLLQAVSKVNFPKDHELKAHIADGLCHEDAIGLELKFRYENAAVAAGFTKKQGFAMLQYASLLKEIKA